ncbi:hypothetical protein LVB87_11475 [Lysobacter sp. KIS68-7]|uniref:hypothetical protein n=1 Tax=Lysobacter sp. KIS68-7 TaxID=2904252 RepID=UPI001E354183|nr:hypothetical protein [Lysobacter sp. KIS68-7]UHQ18801.1 hypothetical protein LVB87_11475 [Lysobacter sp. KIS68-7]
MTPAHENLLRLLAARGEMPGQELVLLVPRLRNDYTDFYGLAALMHAGYMFADVGADERRRMERGPVGSDTQDTAVSLCQLSLPAGESFVFHDVGYESWHDFPVSICITSHGLLKVEELDQRAESRRQRRFDYWFAVAIAILAALASSFFTRLFSFR